MGKPNKNRKRSKPSAVNLLAVLQGGKVSDQDRLAIAEQLTPADYRRQHGAMPSDVGSGLALWGRAKISLPAGERVWYRPRIDNPGRVRWTEEAVRDRLADAVRVLRMLPFPRHGAPAEIRAAHPEIVKTRAERFAEAIEGQGAVTVRRPLPTPAELRMLDETLPWIYAVTDAEMRLALVFRLMGMSLRKVAEIVTEKRKARSFEAAGVSYETIRRWEAEALSAIRRSLLQCLLSDGAPLRRA
ncbi:hypothetical protein [Arenibaculum pallidiluteum]|uniref:hypothetical protein n=1 Tax=Arenibaculum pallidiluteum TaxID=2812559 RepID=UPI001A95ADC0|nr:hypothetical protein [Arenibaculum pallidiluteum]